MSINKYFCSGNLVRDCEVRTAPSGMSITKFTIAVNDRRKNPQTNEWEDYPNYIDCTIFGKLGDKIAVQLTKGSKACIEGSLRQSSWEKDGQKRSKIELIVDKIEVLPKFKDEPYHEETYPDLPF